MISNIIPFIISLLNTIITLVVIIHYRKKKLELEKRMKLIERHVIQAEKKLAKRIIDVSNNNLMISRRLLELFYANKH